MLPENLTGHFIFISPFYNGVSREPTVSRLAFPRQFFRVHPTYDDGRLTVFMAASRFLGLVSGWIRGFIRCCRMDDWVIGIARTSPSIQRQSNHFVSTEGLDRMGPRLVRQAVIG